MKPGNRWIIIRLTYKVPIPAGGFQKDERRGIFCLDAPLLSGRGLYFK